MRTSTGGLKRRPILGALLLVASGRPAAADPQPRSGTDVTSRHLGGLLDLTDHQGRTRSLADFRGKVVPLFFGYTRCPDVCPTTLLRMAEVLRLLGTDAPRVQVLWMAVDPGRDTQSLLANDVVAFNPAFGGLRGTARQTDAVTEAFKVRYDIVYYKVELLVNHCAFGYLIDGRGTTRVKVDHDATPEQVAEDVRAILGGRRAPRRVRRARQAATAGDPPERAGTPAVSSSSCRRGRHAVYRALPRGP